jgi:hypothetical protein
LERFLIPGLFPFSNPGMKEQIKKNRWSLTGSSMIFHFIAACRPGTLQKDPFENDF